MCLRQLLQQALNSKLNWLQENRYRFYDAGFFVPV